jgi:hypothetical protein
MSYLIIRNLGIFSIERILLETMRIDVLLNNTGCDLVGD